MSIFAKKYFVKVWSGCMSAEYYDTGRNEHEVYEKLLRRLGDDCYIIKVEITLNDQIMLKVQEA